MRHILLILPCMLSALAMEQEDLEKIKSLADVRIGGDEGARR